MASGRPSQAMLLVLVFLSASLSGCFSNNDGDDVVYEDSLSITPDPLTAGIFQTVNFEADDDMRVLVPYLILQPSTGYVQNGTVLDLQETIPPLPSFISRFLICLVRY